MKFEEMKKHIPNEKVYSKKIEELCNELDNASSKDEAYKVVKKYFKLSDTYESDVTIISIRNTIDTTNEEYEKAIEKVDEIGPVISNEFQKFEKKLLTCKFRKELEEKLSPYYFLRIENSLKVFDEKIIPEIVEENKLTTEYKKLLASAQLEFNGETLNLSQIGKYMTSSDKATREAAAKLYFGFLEENDAKIGEIYDRLVHIRDTKAKKMGFENFVDFGYISLGRSDYNSKDVAGYRDQIYKTVVPVVKKLRKRQAERLGVKNPDFLDFNLEYLSGNAKPIGDSKFLVEQAQKMYHEMSKESGEFFDFMVENHLMDLDAKKGKAGGGYMTYIPKYKSPFIFANSNGTSQDVDTLTHEVGHAFQGYLGSKIQVPGFRMPTLEACEIDSMSMEFFAWPWMNLFFGDQDDKYRFSHLDSAISFLPYGVEVDEFQHWVYENVDATHEERCAKWAELEKKYRPWLKFKSVPYVGKGKYWMRQAHIFEVPFYYIDYTLAQVLALQFKCEMDKDREKAWRKYIKLLKMGGKYPFVELITKAHLRNPFIDGNVKKVIRPQVKVLDSFDDKKF